MWLRASPQPPVPRTNSARQVLTADTLQGFLARARSTSDPSQKHLYMVDESSLASTEQMRDFLRKIDANDKVLLIGDVDNIKASMPESRSSSCRSQECGAHYLIASFASKIPNF